MKILMITESLTKGGKERRLIELLRAFRDYPQFIFCLVLLKDDIKYSEIYEFKNVELKVFNRRVKKDFKIFPKLHREIKKFNPDLIHSWGSMPSVYVAPIAYLKKIPLINAMIADAVCPKFKTSWIRARLTFPFSTIILANSYAGIKAYNVSQKKARVIHNGFNKDRLVLNTVDKIREHYRINTKYVVSMIGAFHIRKDWNMFLSVAANICEKRRDISFLCVGDGDQLEDYKEKYKNVSDIHFLGKLDQVESIIEISDLGVLVTNPVGFREGISNSILETMAFGKPVIAYDCGGSPEIISNRVNGVLVPISDSKMLLDSILYLVDNDEVRLNMGRSAAESILMNFSIEKMVKGYTDLYRELIN